MSPTVDVVHVVCTDAFAGVERYVATVAREQDSRGMVVRVLGGDPARMRSELAGTDVAWDESPTPWQAVRALRRLRMVSLVHAHMTDAETAAVVSGRAPVVCTRHFSGTRGSSLPARAVGRFVSEHIAGQVAISEFVARSIEGPSTVIHPGVESAPDRQPGREPVVLIAQRLEAEKRTDLGLQMWAASGLAARGWQLKVAGTGSRHNDLVRLAAELGVTDSVHFLGPRSDVAELLARASVFLAPRPDEPYGLSVVEAMAQGTPVVAAAGGGHDETVGSSIGAVLVPASNPVAAGAVLADLAADSERCAQYGAELRDLQRRRFTVGTHVNGLEAFYRSVLA